MISLTRYNNTNHHHHHNQTGHCPTGDDPRTTHIETNCTGVTAKNSRYKGKFIFYYCWICVDTYYCTSNEIFYHSQIATCNYQFVILV